MRFHEIFWPHCDSLLTQKDRLKKTWCQIARQREGGGTGSILTRFHILLFFLLSIFSCPRQPNSNQPTAVAPRRTVMPPSQRRRRRQQTLAQLAVLSWMESCTQSFGVRRIFRGLPHYLHYRPWPNAGAIFSEFFRSFRSTKYRMDR